MGLPSSLPLRTADRPAWRPSAWRRPAWARAARRVLLLALPIFALAPVQLTAQDGWATGNGFFFHRPNFSLSVRGGLDRPTASSDIWNFSTTNLTLNKGDFIAGGYQVDLGARVTNRLEIVAASGMTDRTASSEFRKYIDNNDKPIQQSTRLRRVPVTLGVKYALTAPEARLGRLAWVPARFTPWVGAGGGVMNWKFSQIGDFVDFQTLNVFPQTYAASGWSPMAYANVGLDLKLSTRVGLTGDIRYSAARGSLNFEGSKFDRFNKIDLSGTAATMGITVRM